MSSVPYPGYTKIRHRFFLFSSTFGLAEAGKFDGLKQRAVIEHLEAQKCFSRHGLLFDGQVVPLRHCWVPLRLAWRHTRNTVPA